MAALTNTIPEKTIERLSEYRRTLLASHKQGITHIFSHVLAGIHGITAVQVRRDLMLIGFSSDTKKGYDVQVLIEYISKILDSPSQMNIAVLGMGHLGQAITKYFNGKGLKLKITAAFDVDPEKVGKTIDGIPCYHMDTFENMVVNQDISIVSHLCYSHYFIYLSCMCGVGLLFIDTNVLQIFHRSKCIVSTPRIPFRQYTNKKSRTPSLISLIN